ncbi:MAG: hypothetical protein FJZ11_00065 [Candidatus Omnitrophica bacterium]|nr:hypothetical protein [Candidatus Omnitrophota bacterium]
MYGIENKIYRQLVKLKGAYSLQGIKAEFEAEGSSFRDLIRLRRMTLDLGIKLFLKIGGVEAVKDIKDSLDIGVDGLIAPMVESKFGAKKFIEAYRKIYKDTRLHLTLNIETRTAVKQMEEILDYAKDKVDAITIGRTDLSGSYFNKDIYPDSGFMFNLLGAIGKQIKHYNLKATIGGSLTIGSIDLFKQHRQVARFFDKLETRKVILPAAVMLNNPNAIKEALKFEELYILSKKEINDLFIESDIARLTQLARRL